MPLATNTLGTLAIDTQGIDALRAKAKANPGDSVAAASKQFESLFLGMVLKSMRAATPQDGPFDSDQTRLYTSMLDQQLAQHMAKRGTGLAEVMTRQLSAGLTDENKAGTGLTDMPTVAPVANRVTPNLATPTSAPVSPANQQPGDFVSRVWAHAADAAKTLAVQPQFIVGQAALESGWGKYEIRTNDGQPTHNLFGIKAGGNWNGPSVEKVTTEYVSGVAVKIVDKFRVYASYGEAFRDYASLLKDNARYAGVVGQNDARGFAQGLQRGGYATDPAYAEKLVAVINNARELAGTKTIADPVVMPVVANRVSPWIAAPAPKVATDVVENAQSGGLVRAAYNVSNAGASLMTASRPPSAPGAASTGAQRTSATAAATLADRQPDDFVRRVWPHAVDAARMLGVQPQFIVGQAALETGWGKHEIRAADGQPSHNLFALKAGSDWKGPTVEKASAGYVNGVATRMVEKYRVYASYEEGLRDYAQRLRDNPRYATALEQADARTFAQGLQRGGYATDRAYAEKLVSVINSPPIRNALPAGARIQVAALR